MDIPTLKAKIAAFLQRNVSDFVITNNVPPPATVDLLLEAINTSHRWAQQQRDFENSKVSVDALVDLQNGVPISPLPIHGTSTLVTVKKVLRSFLNDGYGGVRPMRFVSREWEYEDSRQRWDGVPFPWAPSIRDIPSYPTFYEIYLVQMAQTLMIYPNAQVVVPQNPLPVYLDVIRYWPDYIGTESNSDPFLQFGDDFLMWDSCVRLNPIVKEYVPRQEGNVPAPTDERDQAWQDLVLWDANVITTAADDVGTLD